MPLILNRRPGQRTTITFPDGAVAVVECTGLGHVAAGLAPTLEAVNSADGLLIRQSGDGWPVCIIAWVGCFEGSSSRAFSFDAPLDVRIHRDDIGRKL